MNKFRVMFFVGLVGNVVEVLGDTQETAMKAVRKMNPSARITECAWIGVAA